MKKRNIFLSLLLSSLFLAGCAGDEKNILFGGKQDPMGDKDGVMGDGTQKPIPIEGTKPTQSDAIRVDTVDFASFLVDQKSEFKITGRVLIEDYQAQVQIANLQEFPGATYDSTSGIFSWQPNADLIAGTDLYRDLILQVKVIATKPNHVVLLGTRDISIRVNRLLLTPDIVTAAMNSTAKVREGSVSYLTVTLNDPTATADKKTWPTMMISAQSGRGSLVEYVRIYSQDRQPSGQLSYVFAIDLSQAEVTKSYSSFGLTFRAVSMFNKISAERVTTFDVYNKLASPITTWVQPTEAYIGSKFSYQFIIMDPKVEGRLDQPTFSGLPAGATVTCKEINTSTRSCDLVWAVPATETARTVQFSASVNLRSIYSIDPDIYPQSFRYSINLQTPPPTIAEGDLK